jgi:hypothetical protein
MYPLLPAAGSFPAFLNPFDSTFHHSSIDALISIAGSAQIPPLQYGGSVLTLGGWRGSVSNTALNPHNALFGWSYIRIVPAGNQGTTPMRNFQGIVGPRLIMWQVEPGGVPFQT